MINRLLEKISGKWIFLIIVFLFYLILAVVNVEMAQIALSTFVQLIYKLLPVFILVFILIFASNLLLDPKKIIKFIGKESGIKGWMISIFTGILSTGPIYMWYPLLSDFKEKGMKKSLIATFLYNRAVKIPLLPTMIFYFGWPFTIILTIYMIIFSVINGMIVELFLNPKKR